MTIRSTLRHHVLPLLCLVLTSRATAECPESKPVIDFIALAEQAEWVSVVPECTHLRVGGIVTTVTLPVVEPLVFGVGGSQIDRHEREVDLGNAVAFNDATIWHGGVSRKTAQQCADL